MLTDTTKRKRKSLQNIVDKLAKVAAVDDSYKVVEESVKCHKLKPSIMSPPFEVLSAPASPSVASEQGSSAEDDKGSEASETTTSSDNQKVGFCPRAPMRCDVCGLRAYKSYRYISKSSAPQHLKNFVVPSIERFRVCKRCFSSRERCRQNLSLILLKSQTSQMIHVRTPLGVTGNRATNALEYLARDMSVNVKSAYEDELLACDETLGDEDDWGLDDEDEDYPLVSGYKVKQMEPKKLKMNDANNICKQLPFLKNTGLVTVVRSQSGSYNTAPNCYTFYGEAAKESSDADLDALTNQLEEKAVGNGSTKVPGVIPRKSGAEPFTSEIHSISSKLTLLDHAYAQPMPKAKTQVKKTLEPPEAKSGKLKSSSKPALVTNPRSPKLSKPSVLSKEKLQPKRDDKGDAAPVRTCGIVCHLCDQLVTKSYSCLTRETAPDKVKHLFNKPEVKMVKVCRRCVPYKKPKPEEQVDGKGKGSKGKTLLKAVKAAKATKASKAAKGMKMTAAKAKALKLAQASSKSKAIVNAAIMKSNQKAMAAKEANNIVKKETVVTRVEKNSHVRLVPDRTEQTNPNPPDQSTPLNSATKTNVNPPTTDLERTATKLLQTLASAVAQNKSSGNPAKIGDLHAAGTFVSSGGTPVKIMYLSKESIGNTLELTGNLGNPGTQSMKSLIGAGVRKIKLKGGCLIGDTQLPQDISGRTLVNLTNCTAVSVKEEPDKTEKDNALKVVDQPNSGNCHTGNEPPASESTKQSQIESDRAEKVEKLVSKRDEKPDLTQSPRTRNRVALGLPVSTIITRKRSLSMSSEKSDHSADGKQDDRPAMKKKILNALLLNKVKKKESETNSSSTSKRAGSQENTEDGEEPVDDSKPDSQKSSDSGYSTPAALSKRKARTKIVCGSCNQPVVKSYRCLTVLNSPEHIRPLFNEFDDVNKMLRICRRCLVESGKRRKRKS